MDQGALVAGCLLLLVALAGCSAAGSLDMQRVTDDAAITEQASRSATLPEEGPTHDRQVVQRAIENGSTTTGTPRATRPSHTRGSRPVTAT